MHWLDHMGPLRTGGWVHGYVRTVWAVLWFWAAAWSAGRDVLFLAASDSHYRHPDHPLGHHNDMNRATIEEMNRVEELEWPRKLGGGRVGRPRGVVMLGDLVDDGDLAVGGRVVTREQWSRFIEDIGLDGTDGRLRWPVFETWGNHDGPPAAAARCGFSVQAQIAERNRCRLQAGRIGRVSKSGLHYSWDWDDVHFVMLGLYPADQASRQARYSPVWHDPQGALSFLREDLEERVGQSGRPVVLMSHCGFDTDWWTPPDWRAVYDVAHRYRVILYLYGHTGTGIRAWAPEGEPVRWDCINTGHLDAGFFVVHISSNKIRAAYRCKEGLQYVKDAQGRSTVQWGGQWKWSWEWEQPLNP
jgi:hypothetical protein